MKTTNNIEIQKIKFQNEIITSMPRSFLVPRAMPNPKCFVSKIKILELLAIQLLNKFWNNGWNWCDFDGFEQKNIEIVFRQLFPAASASAFSAACFSRCSGDLRDSICKIKPCENYNLKFFNKIFMKNCDDLEWKPSNFSTKNQFQIQSIFSNFKKKLNV